MEVVMKTVLVAAGVVFLAVGGAHAQGSVTVAPDNSETTGSTVVVPGKVRTYVIEQQVPSVTYEGDIALGSELPSSVEIHTIPDNNDYGYAVINKQRVVVNPQTHKIVEIVK
jgi:hypothetical protein